MLKSANTAAGSITGFKVRYGFWKKRPDTEINLAYRPEIDGLRCLAVIPVVMYHADIAGFSGGFVGVDIFFVISGYLISLILFREIYDQNGFSLVGFYERRARRILPAYIFVTAAVLLAGWLWMFPEELVDLGKSIIAASLFASNFYFWRSSDYFSPAAQELPMLHTWTLAIEEQFYLLFPLGLWIIWRVSPRMLFPVIATGFLISIGTAQILAGWKDVANYFLLPSRAWELLAGSLVAFGHWRGVAFRSARIDEALSATGLALLAGSVYLLDASVPFPSLWALPVIVGTASIILCANSQNLVGRLLAWRPFVAIGLISYSLYLWHQPVLVFGRMILLGEPGAIGKFLLILTCLLSGWLSWRYVETPFRDRRKMSRRTIFVSSAIGLTALSSVAFLLIVGKGIPERLTPETIKLLASYTAQRSEIERDLSYCDWIGRSTNNPCLVSKRSPRFILWGDSHARAVARQFDDYFNEGLDKGSILYSNSACPPFIGAAPADNPNCLDRAARLIEGLSDPSMPETVILAARWTLYADGNRLDNLEGGVEYGNPVHLISTESNFSNQPNHVVFERELNNLIKRLRSLGKRVVVIGNAPDVGWNVSYRLARAALTGTSISRPVSTDKSLDDHRRAPLRRVMARFTNDPDVLFLDPATLLCDRFDHGRCVAEINGMPIYADDNHLNRRGATFVAKRFAPQVRSFLENPGNFRND